MFGGIKIFVVPDAPRYQLPADLALPPGFALVPVEPSPQFIARAQNHGAWTEQEVRNLYADIIAAAPAPREEPYETPVFDADQYKRDVDAQRKAWAPAAKGGRGAVWVNGALVCCEENDRDPCPHDPTRRCKTCPGGRA